MTAIARMAMLDLRTIAPYRYQSLLVFGLGLAVFASKPTYFVPGFVLLMTSQITPYPFNVADKAGLETLYAVLPVPRRSVLYGHYAWALANFVVTAGAGTVLALLFARLQAVPYGGRTLLTMLTLSWALFAINIAIQFPLLIRFGYSRVSVLGIALPVATILGIIYRLHLTIASFQSWLPLLWVAGAAALTTSAAVAVTADRRRMRYRGNPRTS